MNTLQKGINIIQAYSETLPSCPGVYRMLNQKYEPLYIGKAKNLKKRVQSYTQPHRLPTRLKRMIAETSFMEFVTTHTEIEALLLEANLIKKLSPRYNILLKDSKFFSFIALSDHLWPRLKKHRGTRDKEGKYYGPFASTDAVENTLTTLHKVFQLRSCSDQFFSTRKRPCLQYYIKRCSAPCVGYIKKEEYQEAVMQTIEFLEGKSHQLQENLSAKMLKASNKREYEKAAIYRNMIQALSQVQSQQTINSYVLKDADIIAIDSLGDCTCIQIFFFRGGSNYGSHSFFPEHSQEVPLEQILSAFMKVFYQDNKPPEEILLNVLPAETKLMEEALSHIAGRKVRLWVPQKGPRRKIVEHAFDNAQEALARRLTESKSQKKLMKRLAEVFELPYIPERIEVYDNSHIQGTNAIGAMIVAGEQGFNKESYRKFIIKSSCKESENTLEERITPGDDYGMMREVMKRRFSGSLAQDTKRNIRPDLLLIDGGKGQLNAVYEVLDKLRLSIPVIGIAKGVDRYAGKETFFQRGKAPISLDVYKDVLFFLQKLRDEAHRFAIGFHRHKRKKHLTISLLDDIEGIGPSRKNALLRRFGSVRSIARAGVDDLQAVEGISATLAQKIYNYFAH
jgi:excinuclease ABC subunit C